MSTQHASALTLNQRFEIIAGWIALKELKEGMQSKGIYVEGGRTKYIEETAKRLGLHEDTVRLVMVEGIRA